MKTVTRAPIPCDCQTRLRLYAETQETPFGLGSVVECDCGQFYTLSDDQREGPFWKRINPTVPGVGLSVAPSETTYDLGRSWTR